MGTRSEVINAPMADTRQRRGWYQEIYEVPGLVADNFALDASMPPVIRLGASAVRDVLMPAASAAMHGLRLVIMSKATTTTGVITLKTSTDAALSPAVTIAQNLSVEMIYIHGSGWKKVG